MLGSGVAPAVPQDRRWQPLAADQIDMLDFALRVARKQAPPNLLQLPLWTEAYE